MIQIWAGWITSWPWIAGYASQPDGYDETLHYTSTSNSTLSSISKVSRHSPAGLSSAHTGSHVDQPPRAVLCLLCGHHVIHGSSPVPACATSYAAGDLPFTVSDLPAGTRAVQWSSGVMPSGWQVVCWGLQGTRPSRGSNITIDDSYNGVSGSNGAYQAAIQWDLAARLRRTGGCRLARSRRRLPRLQPRRPGVFLQLR